jgi:hypothetical protein
MAIDDTVLSAMRPEPLAEVAGRVRDGDILLCSATDSFSRLIRWSTRSPWSHVALAYRWPGPRRIMVLEAVKQLGVRTVTLERFISQTSSGRKPYPGRIILARHADYAAKGGAPGGAGMRRLADFGIDRLGDRFATLEALKVAARIAFGRLDRKMPRFLGPKDEFICSEYVARCLEAVGIEIEWDGRGFIAPADFALDPKVRAIAQIRTR